VQQLLLYFLLLMFAVYLLETAVLCAQRSSFSANFLFTPSHRPT
jgi:hypothetical protein